MHRYQRRFVTAERFIRRLKNKIHKYMSLISNNMFINKLNDIVNKYNNTYSTIKMKPVDLKSSTYTDFDKKNIKEGSKFKVGENVRIRSKLV